MLALFESIKSNEDIMRVYGDDLHKTVAPTLHMINALTLLG